MSDLFEQDRIDDRLDQLEQQLEKLSNALAAAERERNNVAQWFVLHHKYMPSIQDWAARAAKHIADSERKSSVERIAAVISYFTKPLEDLLRASKRAHAETCSRVNEEESDLEPDDLCTCGADEWNKKVDAALDGR